MLQLRVLDPDAHTARVLADVDQKFSEFDHGWAWLDVDVTGATGPVDGVWWAKAVGAEIQVRAAPCCAVPAALCAGA